MVFDRADIGRLEASGDLSEVALHEIAHVLGIGPSDSWDALVRDSVAGIPGPDAHFVGPQATRAFDAAGGASYTGGKVPVDNDDFAHWRDSVLGLELMTPVVATGVRDPLSSITIRALEDMGYKVNAGLAQAFALPSPDIAGEIVEEGPVIDLRNDVYRGPVITIDEEGNIVRVVPGPDDRQPRPTLRSGGAAARADSVIRVTIGSRR